MSITIKNIRDVATVNLLVVGLAACSSSPAPWTQKNDSPWSAKHAAQEDIAPVDSGSSLNDPVLLADPEPVPEPEPVIMQEPEPAPTPEVIVAVIEERTPEQIIMESPTDSYAVQMYAGKTMDSIERYKQDKDLPDLMAVKTDRSGSIVYVLVDVHPDKITANAAASDLEAKTGSKPWVRSIAGLQKIVAQ